LFAGIGALWFCGTHYIVFAKNDLATLRKGQFQVFPLTLDVSHWTISDVIQNPGTVFLFAQQRKAYLLPGGPIIQTVIDSAFAGRPLASDLALQFGEAFGEHGHALIARLVRKRDDSSSEGRGDALKALDYLKQGSQAFTNAKYPEAVAYFQKAVQLAPKFPTAHTNLAIAYMSQYIPGVKSQENVSMAENAFNEFQEVLELDPKDENATAYIGKLYFDQKKMDQAMEWYKKVIAINPKNKEAYYTMGVIAWSQWLIPDREARSRLGMRAEDPGPLTNNELREELKVKYRPMLDEGAANLRAALDLDPEYHEAMAYMNLLIRYRADLVDTQDEYRQQIEAADGWVQKALATKEMKANMVRAKQ
jgi:tetratricopeptide (TPR) repeat protein